jgi:MFS family permease
MNGRNGKTREQSTLKFAVRALRHRNYRLFFFGQGFSLIGTWMQRLAVLWLVYRLTNSPFLLGLAGFIGQLPLFLFASVAGVFVDRWNRYHLLLITQILAMIQACLLAILTLTGYAAVWHLFVLSAFLGLINAFDMPARQSFIIDMVGQQKEDLANAIALNSVMVNGARLAGPFFAGIAVAAFGEGICFLLNALSFLAIVMALLAMNISVERKTMNKTRAFEGLMEGYRYAFGFPPIRYVLILLSLVSLMGMSYQVLMPIFAKEVLHGGPSTLGFLMGAAGVGALISAGNLVSQKSVTGIERLIIFGSALFGIGLIVFSFSHHIAISLIAMLFTGFGMMTVLTSCNTMLQTTVDENKRGRVMSFYAMAFQGMTPFGHLMAGSLASHIGGPNTVMIGGVCCIATSFFFAKKLPEVKSALGEVIKGVKQTVEDDDACKDRQRHINL